MIKKFNHVAVIYGGASAERDVSIQSGEAVAEALRAEGYTVDDLVIDSLSFSVPEGVEAVFIALHGEWGEDGQVQAILEALSIPYVGTRAKDMLASYDKILTKKRLLEVDLPTPAYEVIKKGENPTLAVPAIIKPPVQGSSIGIERVMKPEEWDEALSRSRAFADELLVEAYIPGREFTVGLLNGKILPIVEICAPDGDFNFHAKYTGGISEYHVPADLPEAWSMQCLGFAERCFQAFGCKNLSRVDFRMTSEGEFFILEVNTLPGFTANSLLPKSARALGISFSELCVRLIEAAS